MGVLPFNISDVIVVAILVAVLAFVVRGMVRGSIRSCDCGSCGGNCGTCGSACSSRQIKLTDDQKRQLNALRKRQEEAQ